MENKICQSCRQNFTVEPDDFIFYAKIKVPSPTFCPQCRSVRRLVWWNEHTLYKRSCDLCKKPTISIYSLEYSGIVYCSSCWHSDKWDRESFGKEYDFSKPFFTQFDELFKAMPQSALVLMSSENCEYNNYMTNCKDCYLCFRVHRSQNMLYTYRAKPCSDCTDCLGVFNSKRLYRCIECIDCDNSKYLEFSNGCMDSAFLYNCRNCISCYMCSNLRNKQYCFNNEQLSKDEYRKKIAEINFGSRKVVEENFKLFKTMKDGTIRKYALIMNSKNVTGDNIRNSNNCRESYDVVDVENGAYLLEVLRPSKDIYDSSGGGRNELVYEFGGAGCNNCSFSYDVGESRNVSYSQFVEHSHDMFGCVGIWHKEYCILNKQYTKEEYEALVPKIIAHMNEMPYTTKNNTVYKYGESFPTELSPFAYNESYAQDFFPLTKDEAISQGFRWRDQEARNYQPTMNTVGVPDAISEASDDILKELISCAHEGKCPGDGTICKAVCTSAFKIIPEELRFYRTMNIPLPVLCPNCRQYERLSQKNPTKLWHRLCMCTQDSHSHSEKCQNEFETSYSPESAEKIYCEKCYLLEVN